MKKIFFSPSFPLLIGAAMLILVICQSSTCNNNTALKEQIRAEVEKEFNKKLEMALQQPPNVLSPSDLKTVLANFKDAKLNFEGTNPICTLDDKRIVSLNFGNGLKPDLLVSSNGIAKTGLIEGYRLATTHPDLSKLIVQNWCRLSPSSCTIDFGKYKLDTKLERLIYSYEILSCGTDCPLCEGLTSTENKECRAKCYSDCLNAVRGY